MKIRKLGWLAAVAVIIVIAAFYHTTEDTSNRTSTVNKQETTPQEQQTENSQKANDTNNKNGDPASNRDAYVSDSGKNQIPVKLADTVDGDTIKIWYNGREETVRYLLIDTPESKKPGQCVQPYAKAASYRNQQLVKSGKLTIEFDNGSQRDKYGRLLAYVFVNGKSVQEKLLKEGYARVAYVYDPPYKYLNQFNQAEQRAENQSLRIWSQKGYATNRGFSGCENGSGSSASAARASSTTGSAASSKQSNNLNSSTAAGHFQNCTELRKKYPNGVSSKSPAYQPKMDGDKDGYACERY
ncbi:thermonuclease family protein [Heyndrickxia acidiproducens]|uniref:thermonuclease family protein n=1 Tax=Heyndrickxia acidiproducens TaxID=1121084 RepID=UPI00035ED77A|nr:thermonuclease family protein [Heyndrickxia acidiproducens]